MRESEKFSYHLPTGLSIASIVLILGEYILESNTNPHPQGTADRLLYANRNMVSVVIHILLCCDIYY